MKSVCMETSLGRIVFTLRSDVAPKTSAHFTNLIDAKLYDDVTFYRSDFVIQGGLHGKKGVKNPFPDLNVNEASREDALSNRRGTLSVGHWDVPDCGNSEFLLISRIIHILTKRTVGTLSGLKSRTKIV